MVSIKKKWLEILFLGIAFFLFLLPTYGSPYFSYTGSDPDHYVWNFGWPISSIIYDNERGFLVSGFFIHLSLIVFTVGMLYLFVIGVRSALIFMARSNV